MVFLYLLALAACEGIAAPANSSRTLTPVDSTGVANDMSLFSRITTNPSSFAVVRSALPLVSASLSHPPNTSSGSESTIALASSLFSLSSAPYRSTSPPTSTIYVTDVVTTFETVTVGMTATPTVTPTPSWEDRTFWAAPPQVTDISVFNITYFPSGRSNLKLVADVPSEAIAPTAKFLQALPSPPDAARSTLLELVYPAHSVNPRGRPAGGADFYATPLNLAGARNVTLAYSVLFPADFDWVKGGKLPGLYGGHAGCSGGASAKDCFSTRLMWRRGGVGELYLYAPKDRQSDALCAEVDSVCDAAYGFSVGRGAFNFTPGDWTHLVQNVVLNTPGRNDGVFTLVVDGRRVIERTDMFYRDVARDRGKNGAKVEPAEFIGLFFSTFFGGHGKAYATPRQQYTWFKGFAIARHY